MRPVQTYKSSQGRERWNVNNIVMLEKENQSFNPAMVSYKVNDNINVRIDYHIAIDMILYAIFVQVSKLLSR